MLMSLPNRRPIPWCLSNRIRRLVSITRTISGCDVPHLPPCLGVLSVESNNSGASDDQAQRLDPQLQRSRGPMQKIRYLAYGSNLHPLRLEARVQSARALGVVELPGYALAFHKRSIDGSAKCHVYADQGLHARVYGVVYELAAGEKGALDRHEGKGSGYYEHSLRVQLNGESSVSYLYLAQPTHIDTGMAPYDWYKALVVAGARFHGFPADYIAAIDATPSRPDPDLKRAREHEDLLRRMLQHDG